MYLPDSAGKSWQCKNEILISVLLAGLGAALVTMATFSIIGKYFPGKQLVPVAANVLFFNVGVSLFPLIIGE